MSHISCFLEEDRYSVLEKLMLEGKNICLFGTGNNGKTYIIDKVLRNHPELSYNREYSGEYHKNLSTGKYILESNRLESIPNDIDTIVEFKGRWNNDLSKYE
jgi:hypothetical protein